MNTLATKKELPTIYNKNTDYDKLILFIPRGTA